METPLVVFGKFRIQKDKIEELKELAREFIAETLAKEPGCVSYNLLQSQDDPTLFTSNEIWATPAAETAHWETDHLRNFLLNLSEFLDGDSEVEKYKRV